MPLPIVTLYRQVQNTRVWLFVKGVFLLFLAAMVAFDTFLVYVLLVLLAVFAILGGIVTIIMGLINLMEHKSYRAFALIIGFTSLILGAIFFIWPAFSTQFWVIFYLLQMMLEALLIVGAMVSIKAMGASKWWPTVGGLIVLFFGLFFIFQVATVSPGNLAQIDSLVATYSHNNQEVLTVWNSIGNYLAIYLFVSAIFFFVTVIVTKPKNVMRSVVNKTERKVKKKVRKIVKPIKKAEKKIEKKVKKAVKDTKKTINKNKR